jgi:hypothetical protein
LGEVKSADQSCSCRLNNRPNRAILAADFFDSIDPLRTSQSRSSNRLSAQSKII